MKINSYQTTSEFYNPNNRENASKNESRNGKQTASSLPKVAHSKKQNYVSDNDYSMDMMIDDEEFETKKINDQKDPKIVGGCLAHSVVMLSCVILAVHCGTPAIQCKIPSLCPFLPNPPKYFLCVLPSSSSQHKGPVLNPRYSPSSPPRRG